MPKKYLQYGHSRIVILPVSFDKTASWIKGSSRGPEAIIKASDYLEWYDLETKSEVYKRGIFTAPEIKAESPEALVKKVRTETAKYLEDNKFVVTLGGEHTVFLGALESHFEKFKNISLLHLDAHSDRRNVYEKSRYSHACVMARANELTRKITSVGVRSVAKEELPLLRKNTVFFSREIQKSSVWIKNVLKSLGGKVYVTIDLDVLDPAFMPAVGTPEPGGLTWYQLTDLLREVAMKKEIVGFDVVELCPIKNNPAPDFLAAKLIYQTLSYIFASKNRWTYKTK